jgi:hypothetical protein
MGTSFTDFRGRGFWTTDAKLELWLFTLCSEIDDLSEPPHWIKAARELWHLQATVGFGACVNADLDELVGDDEARVTLLRELARQASQRLHSKPMIPRDLLNSYGLGGPGRHWATDLDPTVMDPVAEAFDELLAGTLTTDASTSPIR